MHSRLTTPTIAEPCSIARTYAGPRLPLPEIQVNFHDPDDKGRGRLVAMGVPPAEIRQVAATVIPLSTVVHDLDRCIQVRLLGAERYQRRYGLALSIALLSAVTFRSVPADHIFVGEVDLYQRIRDVPDRLIENLMTSLNEGEISTPITLYVPPSAAEELDGAAGVQVVACATVRDAVDQLWRPIQRKPKK